MTHEKLSSLQRDMEELSYSEQTEEEITQLKRSKIDSERKCKEQEDELDEMAGQIQVRLLCNFDGNVDLNLNS